MLGLIGNIGPWELILILVIVLVIFGPGKLPKVGESIGKALNSFKKAREEDDEETDAKKDK
ncbi:MAG TPA: twin-arginine translocase TatA/TatE family subunit [Syntrophomonadaceae bacterium]|nr:twin-arginine translocase TatA/TatE family subunit [Syntrophomonadaceae bacterium]